MIKLVIVDDHTLFREGLASIIQSEPDIEIVGMAGSVLESLEVVRRTKPDLILMDYTLPDGTGADATQMILDEFPDSIIIFLTVSENDDNLLAAIRSGAKGYLIKNMSPSKLVNALRSVIQGEAALSRKMTRTLIERIADKGTPLGADQMDPGLQLLTSREMDVLVEIVKDATNKEIAQALGISVFTVKNHISNILSKLSLNNRREAASLARKFNIGPAEKI